MPKLKRPLKVFLCHAHADRDPVRGLYARLIKDGVDAWFDKAKLLPGQDWELEIRKAVREADVVVVCLSKQFNQAGFRQKEVRLALDTAMEQPEGEIFIIPARLEKCDILESLKRWQWVDLFEKTGYVNLTNVLQLQAQKIHAKLSTRKQLIPGFCPNHGSYIGKSCPYPPPHGTRGELDLTPVKSTDDFESTTIPQWDGEYDYYVDKAELISLTPVNTALLWAKEGPKRGNIYPIRRSIVIGRKEGLILDDPTVSSMHAKFALEEGKLVVWDLGSSNGTYVNGKRIRGATMLKENDLIKIGDTIFVVKLLDMHLEKTESKRRTQSKNKVKKIPTRKK